VVFEQRIELMESTNISETISRHAPRASSRICREAIPERAYAEQWDAAGLKERRARFLNLDLPIEDWARKKASPRTISASA
jgi:preprotein translocase subunit SecA